MAELILIQREDGIAEIYADTNDKLIETLDELEINLDDTDNPNYETIDYDPDKKSPLKWESSIKMFYIKVKNKHI